MQRLYCGDGQMRVIAMPRTPEEALAVLEMRSKYEDSGYRTPCRVWVGAKAGRGKGYGTIRYKNRVVKTHWLSWTLKNGEVPKGKELCHRCDNSICFREDHLFPGTHRENMQDAGKKGKIGFVRGERHYAHKLTEAQVANIRREYRPGRSRSLGKRYGVSNTMIFKIVKRKNWKHLP